MNLFEQETQPHPEYRLIPISKGYFAKVDIEDFERVSKKSWYALVIKGKTGDIRCVYATGKGERNNTILLHRFILGVTDRKMDIDHRDHNGLNCRRSNLRVCTRTQNNANRVYVKNRSGFKGVLWDKNAKQWRVLVKNEYMGSRKTAVEAARFYDEVALKTFGEFALLNFPPK